MYNINDKCFIVYRRLRNMVILYESELHAYPWRSFERWAVLRRTYADIVGWHKWLRVQSAWYMLSIKHCERKKEKQDENVRNRSIDEEVAIIARISILSHKHRSESLDYLNSVDFCLKQLDLASRLSDHWMLTINTFIFWFQWQ